MNTRVAENRFIDFTSFYWSNKFKNENPYFSFWWINSNFSCQVCSNLKAFSTYGRASRAGGKGFLPTIWLIKLVILMSLCPTPGNHKFLNMRTCCCAKAVILFTKKHSSYHCKSWEQGRSEGRVRGATALRADSQGAQNIKFWCYSSNKLYMFSM